MSKDELESVTIRPPRRGETRHFAGTAATQIFAVPAEWKGLKIRFEAVGDKFAVMTAPDNAIAIDMAATKDVISSGPGFALSPTPSSSFGDWIADGQYKEYDFTGADLFVGFRGTGTSGSLLVRPAETALGAT